MKSLFEDSVDIVVAVEGEHRKELRRILILAFFLSFSLSFFLSFFSNFSANTGVYFSQHITNVKLSFKYFEK